MDVERRERFDALVRQRFPFLLRFGYLLTRDWQQAEDLAQTALAKAWFRWDGLRDPDAAEVYIRRIMVSTYAKWWRRRWRGEIPTAVLPDWSARDPAAERGADRDALTRALLTLPARARTMLALRFYEDLGESEVAEIMGCSVGTVKSTVSRALARLRADGALSEFRTAAADPRGMRDEESA